MKNNRTIIVKQLNKMDKILNIEPAGHIKRISEYYFSVKLAEVAKMNAEGKNIISLGVGAPDKMPSQETIETLCEAAHRPDVHA